MVGQRITIGYGNGTLTRQAVALRDTMMIGQIGRYLESMRAEEPLYSSVGMTPTLQGENRLTL